MKNQEKYGQYALCNTPKNKEKRFEWGAIRLPKPQRKETHVPKSQNLRIRGAWMNK